MAALGWLLNLDFAAGGASSGGLGGETIGEAVLRRPPIAYEYGYRYIQRGVAWMIFSLL